MSTSSIRRRSGPSKNVTFGKLEDLPEETGRKPAQRIKNFARYGNTVFEIKETGDDPLYIKLFEAGLIVLVIVLGYISFYHFEAMHFHVAKGYGHLGFPTAQHVVGQKYLAGKGVEANETEAMKWFRKAADQGHAEASFNLAVGHIHGAKTGLRPGQATRLLKHAHRKGVKEAEDALSLCKRRGCDL